MPGKNDKAEKSPDENIVFYDAIAQKYDSTLQQTKSNAVVRQRVAERFCSVVKQGWVIDFGGGTGLDMNWLTKNGYKIFFCEPSSGMRQQAINYNNHVLHSSNIIFLDNSNTDFKTWSNNPPILEKVNGILSNFAVLNNIYELELLFKSFALILHTGGHLIALILANNFQKKSPRKFLNTLISFVLQKPVRFYVKDKANKQIVYIHSLHQIKKASKPYFHFCSVDSFSEFGFVLIHLTKK